jgi:hypothetical protein
VNTTPQLEFVKVKKKHVHKRRKNKKRNKEREQLAYVGGGNEKRRFMPAGWLLPFTQVEKMCVYNICCV